MRAAVAVGRERDPAPLGEQDPAGQAVDGRHLALDEQPQVLDPERLVLVEERRRLGVVLRARHHVQGNRDAVAPPERDHLLGVDLKQRPVGDGADRVAALRAVEAEARALPAGDDHDRHLPRRQRTAARQHVLGPRPHDLGRLDRPGVDGLSPFEQRPHQAGDEVEVDLADVCGEARPLPVVQLVPEAQQMLLAVARQAQEELPHVRRAQVNRYGGRWTPRSVTIALTYSAGVTSKAGL